ncbi:MAG TPA: hypothetical protein VFJ77_10060 [Gaiellaceae bacterium]|nr:hypothetical protein [Gaiellaceae bacterium]
MSALLAWWRRRRAAGERPRETESERLLRIYRETVAELEDLRRAA